MKCWNCKKKDIKHAWRVPVVIRGVEKFRDFCDNCYQGVKKARQDTYKVVIVNVTNNNKTSEVRE